MNQNSPAKKNFQFAKDKPENMLSDVSEIALSTPLWKILIADDDPEVHDVTYLALRRFKFKEKGLKFLQAYSGTEAKKLLEKHPDTAVILLDVVMETDKTGLDLVHHIRQDLNNKMIRIILRTGQPGQAPAKEIILNYDINDYKLKTDLTAQRLFTTIVAALRTYSDLQEMQYGREQLAIAYTKLEKQIAAHEKLELAQQHLQQELIEAQQQIIRELSTPIIPLLDGIIIMPLVGQIDSNRARAIMRALLAGITTYQAQIVIIDVTGVNLLDSLVAQNLNKTMQAARLKGAKTIITGISDSMAETVVDLGLDWGDMITMNTLQTGLAFALKSLHRP